jgi:hypothetical protein
MFQNLTQAVTQLRHFERIRGYGDGGFTEDRELFRKRVERLKGDSSIEIDERGQALFQYAGIPLSKAP